MHWQLRDQRAHYIKVSLRHCKACKPDLGEGAAWYVRLHCPSGKGKSTLLRVDRSMTVRPHVFPSDTILRNGHLASAKELLDAGACITRKCTKDWTPIILASMGGHHEVSGPAWSHS